jgi:hypothetical protein
MFRFDMAEDILAADGGKAAELAGEATALLLLHYMGLDRSFPVLNQR